MIRQSLDFIEKNQIKISFQFLQYDITTYLPNMKDVDKVLDTYILHKLAKNPFYKFSSFIHKQLKVDSNNFTHL